MCLGSRLQSPTWSFFICAKYTHRLSSAHSIWCKCIEQVFVALQQRFHVIFRNARANIDSIVSSASMYSLMRQYNEKETADFPVWILPIPDCCSNATLRFSPLNIVPNSITNFSDGFISYDRYRWDNAERLLQYEAILRLLPTLFPNESKYFI